MSFNSDVYKRTLFIENLILIGYKKLFIKLWFFFFFLGSNHLILVSCKATWARFIVNLGSSPGQMVFAGNEFADTVGNAILMEEGT